MNERIEGLWRNARIGSVNNHQNPEVLEKFAQLIVRECALTAGLMEHEGRPNIGAGILDRFGVKE